LGGGDEIDMESDFILSPSPRPLSSREGDENLKSKQSEIRNPKSAIGSLIPKPILVPAVRTLPGDGIAGHPPYVFIHAFLTDMEAAPAPPAKAKFPPAAVAGKAGAHASFSSGP
jgi:hypothetical protein